MQFIISEIQKCLQAHAWYAALALALTLPAICGAVENPKHKNQRRTKDKHNYISWLNSTFLPHKYGSQFPLQLYAFRCAVLHEGSFFMDSDNSFPRIMVVDQNPNLTMINCTISTPDGNVIIHDAPTLCSDLIKAAQDWEISIQGNAVLLANLNRVVRVHPDGIFPYFKGVPIIG